MKAAEVLKRHKNRRSCVSRAYYAAFAAVTGEVRKRTTDFPRGYEHPPHMQIGRFIKRHLTHLPKAERDELRDAVERLRRAREDADYRREATLQDDDVRYALLDAHFVVDALEAS